MRDFPVFTTENGIGSLILKEIPYSGNAYIKIQASQCPEAFLAECMEFCHVAGAKNIYAAGADFLNKFPFHTALWKMQAHTENLPQTDACLFPVSAKTAEQWRTIYNDKMRTIPNSGYISVLDMQKICKDGTGYFVHENGKLLGIGKAEYGKIDVVISLQPGAGRQVVCALAHGVCGELVELEVASANQKAVALYEQLGFTKCAELSRWYHVK